MKDGYLYVEIFKSTYCALICYKIHPHHTKEYKLSLINMFEDYCTESDLFYE